MRTLITTLAILMLPMAVNAGSDEYGTTNPLESGFGRVMEDIANEFLEPGQAPYA